MPRDSESAAHRSMEDTHRAMNEFLETVTCLTPEQLASKIQADLSKQEAMGNPLETPGLGELPTQPLPTNQPNVPDKGQTR